MKGRLEVLFNDFDAAFTTLLGCSVVWAFLSYALCSSFLGASILLERTSFDLFAVVPL
jgi:hypothetical protein